VLAESEAVRSEVQSANDFQILTDLQRDDLLQRLQEELLLKSTQSFREMIDSSIHQVSLQCAQQFDLAMDGIKTLSTGCEDRFQRLEASLNERIGGHMKNELNDCWDEKLQVEFDRINVLEQRLSVTEGELQICLACTRNVPSEEAQKDLNRMFEQLANDPAARRNGVQRVANDPMKNLRPQLSPRAKYLQGLEQKDNCSIEDGFAAHEKDWTGMLKLRDDLKREARSREKQWGELRSMVEDEALDRCKNDANIISRNATQLAELRTAIAHDLQDVSALVRDLRTDVADAQQMVFFSSGSSRVPPFGSDLDQACAVNLEE